MMRVHHSVFAAVVKSLVSIRDRIAAKKGTFSGRTIVGRQIARGLCVILVVSLLATSSPSAPSTIGGWAREWQPSAASWMRPNSIPTKLFRSLEDSYGRYENWLSAHAAGKQHKTGNAPSTPPSAGHSTGTGSMPLVPSMVPPPPDAPPTFFEDPLEAGVTVVQALHITQLQEAVDLVRVRAGLPGASWDVTVGSGLPIKATHILELRTELDSARNALGLPPAGYSPPSPILGGGIRAAHVQEIREHIKAMFGTAANAETAVAQLDPRNETGGGGENPLSRNYNLNIPLLGLPGRAGLDLGLSLGYNSLVWTKHGSSISFDDDRGFPSPGFRLGFPVIKPLHYNSETSKYAFMLITPDGGHTELRRVNSSALYEAADSSHLLFDAANLVLRTTDGTKLSYAWSGSDYQCTEIKDRNGNFITITYTALWRISTVVDTLGRVITFNYDGTDTLTSITQLWNGQAHTWASFEYYPAAEIQTNFQGLINLGPQNGATIKVLSKVTLNDNSRFEFEYTYWGQIWKVRNHAADGHLLNYRAYNLPGEYSTPQTDCPRFTERHDWAENWNRGEPDGPAGLPTGPELEVLTASWIDPESASWNLPNGTPQTGTLAKVTAVDGTYNKIYFEGVAGTTSGWRRGLPSMVETWASTTPGGPVIKQKTSVSKWTQEDNNVSYILNPRVEESNIYDFDSGGLVQNRARTTVTYLPVSIGDGTSCQRPEDVFEYEADATTVLRRTHTDYVPLTSAYTSRRIIALVGEQSLYSQTQTLVSKVGFAYDEVGSIQDNDAPVQHDNANYAQGFTTGRANLSSVKRFDVNTSAFTTSTITYNTAGATVASTDPLGHTSSVSYADNFSDGNNGRNTLAYPTTGTDAGGFSATTKYNFDFGAVTRAQSPPPAGQSVGAIKNFTYDSMARLEKQAIEFNGNTDYSHSRFVYPLSQNRLDTYVTIQEGLGEAHSFRILDGHSRAFATASDHPGSTGGLRGQLLLFDKVGRVVKRSNPTETNATGAPSQWAATGDDATAGWPYSQQTYDWKGRPLVSTNTDSTTKEASYIGCGCAGGAAIVTRDEMGRRQKSFSDPLGRTWKTQQLFIQPKTEVLNGNGTVYSTIINTFNARDQVTNSKHYQGAETSGIYQESTVEYDGHARVLTSRQPAQTAPTTFSYYADDTVEIVTDARGATKTLIYNNRKLVTSISYDAPAGIPATPTVTFDYDGAGNRLWMVDGSGRTDYGYNALSRLTSESKQFTGLSGPYPLTYGYTLGGSLESITDPASAVATYEHDQIGRLTKVTSTSSAQTRTLVDNLEYRAWGAIKKVKNGTSHKIDYNYNSRLQLTQTALTDPLGRKDANKPLVDFYMTDYEYYGDGAIKRAASQGAGHAYEVSPPDRSYIYDDVGRLIESASNAIWENGNVIGKYQGTYFRQYEYDAWDHNTHASGTYWYQQLNPVNTTYVNDRNVDFTYDQAGNLLGDEENLRKYDAAGQLVEVTHGTGHHFVYSYDGDGQLVKTVNLNPGPGYGTADTNTYYFLRSTVVGDKVMTANNLGMKRDRIVYTPGGMRLREVRFGSLEDKWGGASDYWDEWLATVPLTGTMVSLKDGDATLGGIGWIGELDPLGNHAANDDPYYVEPEPPPPPDYEYPASGDTSDLFNGCYLDGVSTPCDWALQALNSETAVQCRNNYCGPSNVGRRDESGNIISQAWMVFTGSGAWVSDGESSDNLFFSDLRFGSLLDAASSHFGPQKKKKAAPTRPREPIYPPVTASDINIVDGSKPFDVIGKQVVNDIVDIANNRKCSDAFKKWNLRIPYDLVLSDKIRIVPSGFLYDDAAGHTLGISQDLVESIRYDLSPGIIFRPNSAATTIPGANPIIVIGSDATEARYLGLKSVLIHEFIHAGGKRGSGGGKNGDLTDFVDGYKEIQEACGGKSN